MKKEETKKVNDPVGEYLVKRINELENDNLALIQKSIEQRIVITTQEEKLKVLEELQSLFRLENGVVCLYDKDGHFQDAIATDFTEFGKYLVKLLDLKEKE